MIYTSIPNAAYDVVRYRYGLDNKQALANFNREIIYQCRNSKEDPSVNSAIVISTYSDCTYVYDKDSLHKLGYDYSVYSDGTEALCEDVWNRYVSALYSVERYLDINREKLHKDTLGLAFIYLVSLYMQRKSKTLIIPSKVVLDLRLSCGAKYWDGVLTFTSETYDEYDDSLLGYDVIWYQHWIYEGSAYCKTLLTLDTGIQKEVISDYYPEMNIISNCELCLGVASETNNIYSEDTHPELSVRTVQ